MLIHTFRLAILLSLPVALIAAVYSFDLVLTIQVAVWPAAAMLLFGFFQQWNLNLKINQGKQDRALFHPLRHFIDQPPPPIVSAVPAPNNTLEQPLHASRSIVLNANGQTGQLSLYPASNELVEFLEACIRLSSADSLRFPPVLDLKHIGIPYEQQDAMFALLGDAVIRKGRRPTLIKNGYNLGDLRRMAAGG